MSPRELTVSGPAGDPRVKEQVKAVRADPDGARERDLEVRELEADELCVELRGRDGSVMARWGDLVTVSELWARIDAMPMRRRELRERAAAGQPSGTPPV